MSWWQFPCIHVEGASLRSARTLSVPSLHFARNKHIMIWKKKKSVNYPGGIDSGGDCPSDCKNWAEHAPITHWLVSGLWYVSHVFFHTKRNAGDSCHKNSFQKVLVSRTGEDQTPETIVWSCNKENHDELTPDFVIFLFQNCSRSVFIDSSPGH